MILTTNYSCGCTKVRNVDGRLARNRFLGNVNNTKHICGECLEKQVSAAIDALTHEELVKKLKDNLWEKAVDIF